MQELHVVFGATGGSGAAVVRALVAQGKPVRAVNRSGRGQFGPGVELVQADALDAASVRAACRGATTVYNCVGVPYQQWATHLPPIMTNILDGAAATGARLVFADNTYMYGKLDGPMTEDRPYRPISRKGALRAQMAERLMEAHASGKAQVTIGRAADFYGPDVHVALMSVALFRAAQSGKRVSWAGHLDMPHTMMFIDDMARGLVTLGRRPEALGQVWHLPHAPAITGRAFLEQLFAEVGKPPRIGVLRPWLVRLAGLVNAQAREFAEMIYQFDAPFVVDSSKYTRVFGVTATPYREGIRQTLAWIGQEEQRTESREQSAARA